MFVLTIKVEEIQPIKNHTIMTKYEIAAAIEEIRPQTRATVIYNAFSKKELTEWLEELKRK